MKDAGASEPTCKDLLAMGTTGKVLQFSRDEKSPLRVLIEGRRRFGLRKIPEEVPYLVEEAEVINQSEKHNAVTKTLTQSVSTLFKICLSLAAPISEEVTRLTGDFGRPGKIACLIGQFSGQ
jgi:ATP-dependent Lon protease